MTRTQALQRLQAKAEEHGQQWLADQLGCTRSFVCLLLQEERSPGRRISGVLQKKFKIPYSVWDQAA